MKEKEPEEPTKTEPSAIPSRRDFLAALGAVTGLAASGAAALVTAEDAEAAAIAYPEASPSFAGAPSASFLSSGQPLTGPGLSQSYSYPAGAAAPQESWPAGVPSYTAPNFLVIMVDELWNSLWLPNDANNNPSTAAIDANCPNLASLRDNSIRFLSYYAAACNCTPSRGTINTGLYARQTNLYSTQVAAVSPNLQLVTNAQGSQTGFSTFGSALQDSIFGVGYNSPSPYLGNVYHVGKWHLSNFTGNMPASALSSYGFQYVRSMKPSQSGPSPNGIINEGQQSSNHGNPVGGAAYYSSDPDVTNYALSTLGSIASGSAPWCLVVSYINPHDMADYPAYFSSPANGYNMWPPPPISRRLLRALHLTAAIIAALPRSAPFRTPRTRRIGIMKLVFLANRPCRPRSRLKLTLPTFRLGVGRIFSTTTSGSKSLSTPRLVIYYQLREV